MQVTATWVDCPYACLVVVAVVVVFVWLTHATVSQSVVCVGHTYVPIAYVWCSLRSGAAGLTTNLQLTRVKKKHHRAHLPTTPVHTTYCVLSASPSAGTLLGQRPYSNMQPIWLHIAVWSLTCPPRPIPPLAPHPSREKHRLGGCSPKVL